MRVLAIDQGTSATKAIVVDDGIVVAEASAPCAPAATPDDGVEVDPESIWQSLLRAGRDALRRAGGGQAPDAIGLANQGETIVAWDRATGDPIGPAIVWQDRRSDAVCERIRAAGGAAELEAITGLELDPYFVAPKVAWLRARVGAGPTITTSDVWLLHRLCGSFVTDAATASRTLLMDLRAVAWSDAACAAFGIDPASLPDIVANAGPIGHTDVFGGVVPVTGLCVDQQAALFAQSCVEAGEAKCTYGTGAFLLASTGATPTWSRNGLVGSVGWQLDSGTTWCLDGQVYTVGAAVTWLQHIGCIDGPQDLDGLGDTVTGSGGVTFIPGLAGLGAPFWAPQAKGSLTGLSLGTSRAHVVRAVVEGIAAQVAWLARAAAADLGAPLTRLRVDGGLTRSRLLLQVQADLLQVPVEVYPSPDATALGVASFARIGAGDLDAPAAWQPAAVVEPSIGAEEADDRLARWRAIADATVALDA